VQFIGNNNGDFLMEDGEKAEITVWLKDRDNAIAETASNAVQVMDLSTANGGGIDGIEADDTLIGKSHAVLATDRSYDVGPAHCPARSAAGDEPELAPAVESP
jgi:hypothetical protein